MRNYPVQACAVDMMALRSALEASDILRERQGRNCGGPSGATHRSVRLRKVLERTCIKTGVTTRFVYDESAPFILPEHEPGSTVFTSYADLFSDSLFSEAHFHVFTLTEEEFDHEQYQREA